jgi:hypothetical protein
MVTLATTERLVPPLAAPTRDARPAIAAALLHVGVAAALLLGWRHAPSEVPGSFAVSLVLEPAPAVASGAAEAAPDSPTPQTEETAEPADPAPEIAPAPVLDAEVATTEPMPPGRPPLSPELAAEPAAIEAPEPEIPVAKLAPALPMSDALAPPLPAAKPTPPPAATVAEPVPQRTLASPPPPSAAARAAGDPRSTVDAPTPETRTATVGSSAAPPAPVLLDRPRYRERPAPPRYPMRAREPSCSPHSLRSAASWR